MILLFLIRCGQESEHCFSNNHGTKQCSESSEAQYRFFGVIICGDDSEHCLGTRMGPTSVLNLLKLSTDPFVFFDRC